MADEITRYPLTWPTGKPRTPSHMRKDAPFHQRKTVYSSDGQRNWTQKESLSVSNALKRLSGEISRLVIYDAIISSNMRLNLDGTISASNPKMLTDPGVAVYFKIKGKPRVLACDKWRSAAENMAAIAGHIEAIRAQDRYGVGTLDEAFAGYVALPADSAANWRLVFGFKAEDHPTLDQLDSAWKKRAREAHPDVGGSDVAMAYINRARDYALQELRG